MPLARSPARGRSVATRSADDGPAVGNLDLCGGRSVVMRPASCCCRMWERIGRRGSPTSLSPLVAGVVAIKICAVVARGGAVGAPVPGVG